MLFFHSVIPLLPIRRGMPYYGVRRRKIQTTQVAESREDGRKHRQKPLLVFSYSIFQKHKHKQQQKKARSVSKHTPTQKKKM